MIRLINTFVLGCIALFSSTVFASQQDSYTVYMRAQDKVTFRMAGESREIRVDQLNSMDVAKDQKATKYTSKTLMLLIQDSANASPVLISNDGKPALSFPILIRNNETQRFLGNPMPKGYMDAVYDALDEARRMNPSESKNFHWKQEIASNLFNDAPVTEIEARGMDNGQIEIAATVSGLIFSSPGIPDASMEVRFTAVLEKNWRSVVWMKMHATGTYTDDSRRTGYFEYDRNVKSDYSLAKLSSLDDVKRTIANSQKLNALAIVPLREMNLAISAWSASASTAAEQRTNPSITCIFEVDQAIQGVMNAAGSYAVSVGNATGNAKLTAFGEVFAETNSLLAVGAGVYVELGAKWSGASTRDAKLYGLIAENAMAIIEDVVDGKSSLKKTETLTSKLNSLSKMLDKANDVVPLVKNIYAAASSIGTIQDTNGGNSYIAPLDSAFTGDVANKVESTSPTSIYSPQSIAGVPSTAGQSPQVNGVSQSGIDPSQQQQLPVIGEDVANNTDPINDTQPTLQSQQEWVQRLKDAEVELLAAPTDNMGSKPKYLWARIENALNVLNYSMAGIPKLYDYDLEVENVRELINIPGALTYGFSDPRNFMTFNPSCSCYLADSSSSVTGNSMSRETLGIPVSFSITTTSTLQPANDIGFAIGIFSFDNVPSGAQAWTEVLVGKSNDFTFNQAGHLTELTVKSTSDPYPMHVLIGTSTPADTGMDSQTGIHWGRWDGSTSGVADAALYNTYIVNGVTANNPLVGATHYVVGGDIATTLPLTGVATYNYVGGTVPTNQLINTGILNSVTLSADFSAKTVNAFVSATVAGTTLSSTGSNLPISNAANFTGSSVGGNVSVTCVGVCGPSNTGGISGFFSGLNANGAALTYSMNTGNGAGNSGTTISGAAAFRK